LADLLIITGPQLLHNHHVQLPTVMDNQTNGTFVTTVFQPNTSRGGTRVAIIMVVVFWVVSMTMTTTKTPP
jgi:hypothetical protein